MLLRASIGASLDALSCGDEKARRLHPSSRARIILCGAPSHKGKVEYLILEFVMGLYEYARRSR